MQSHIKSIIIIYNKCLYYIYLWLTNHFKFFKKKKNNKHVNYIYSNGKQRHLMTQLKNIKLSENKNICKSNIWSVHSDIRTSMYPI